MYSNFEKSLSLTQLKKFENLKTSETRRKLIESGLKRDTSAITPRPRIQKREEITPSLQRKESSSLERIMIKSIKTLAVIPSPIRLKNSSTTRSKTETNNERKENYNKSLSKKDNPDNTQIKNLLIQLDKAINQDKLLSKTILQLAKEINAENFPLYKENLDFLLNELNAFQIGSSIPMYLYQTINELSIILGIKKTMQYKTEKTLQENNILLQIVNKFTIRIFNEFKIIQEDNALYSAFLTLMGAIGKKTSKLEPVCEIMKKFIKNPGLAVKEIKKLPKMLQESLIDKGNILFRMHSSKL